MPERFSICLKAQQTSSISDVGKGLGTITEDFFSGISGSREGYLLPQRDIFCHSWERMMGPK
jgi:hypothetical protein